VNKYAISLSGYGWELFIGQLSQSAYQYFKDGEIDFLNYALGSENIAYPSCVKFPFTPGNIFRDKPIHTERGPFVNERGIITVLNDSGEEIWSCKLTMKKLIECNVKVNVTELDKIIAAKHTHYYCFADIAKGIHLNDEIVSKKQFDQGRLTLDITSFGGKLFVSNIKYGRRVLNDSSGFSKGVDIICSIF